MSCAMYPLARSAIHNGLDVWAYRNRLLPHKKKEGFAYSDYLPWPDKVPDWVREGKATSDTDIIRLRRRFCYTSLFFTLTVFSRNLQKFAPYLDKEKDKQ